MIPFGSVVFDAEHLAIINVGLASFAPGDNVVSIHFLELELRLFPAFGGADGADALLALIDQAFGGAVEQAEVEEALVTS